MKKNIEHGTDTFHVLSSNDDDFQKGKLRFKERRGEVWECVTRSIGMEKAIITCTIVFLWFLPILMLSYTYISVVLTLVKSMKEAAALMEGKG